MSLIKNNIMEEYESDLYSQFIMQAEVINANLKYCSYPEQKTSSYRKLTRTVDDIQNLICETQTNEHEESQFWLQKDLLYNAYKLKAMIYDLKMVDFISDNDLDDPICEIFTIVHKIYNCNQSHTLHEGE